LNQFLGNTSPTIASAHMSSKLLPDAVDISLPPIGKLSKTSLPSIGAASSRNLEPQSSVTNSREQAKLYAAQVRRTNHRAESMKRTGLNRAPSNNGMNLPKLQDHFSRQSSTQSLSSQQFSGLSFEDDDSEDASGSLSLSQAHQAGDNIQQDPLFAPTLPSMRRRSSYSNVVGGTHRFSGVSRRLSSTDSPAALPPTAPTAQLYPDLGDPRHICERTTLPVLCDSCSSCLLELNLRLAKSIAMRHKNVARLLVQLLSKTSDSVRQTISYALEPLRSKVGPATTPGKVSAHAPKLPALGSSQIRPQEGREFNQVLFDYQQQFAVTESPMYVFSFSS
jgi:hypothetical protein